MDKTCKSSVSEAHVGYLETIEKCLRDDTCFKTFKSIPGYAHIVENLSEKSAIEYASQASTLPNVEKWLDYSVASVNDEIGGATTYNFDTPINARLSPTTVRYVKVAAEIMEWFDLRSASSGASVIAEIGCGYGGQFLVLKRLLGHSKTLDYYVIDLPQVLELVKKYVDYHIEQKNIQGKLHLISAFDDLALSKIPDPDVVISNFAFSELSKVHRDRYAKLLLSRAKNGYMVVNHFMNRAERQLFHEQIVKDWKRFLALKPDVNQVVVWSTNSNYIVLWTEKASEICGTESVLPLPEVDTVHYVHSQLSMVPKTSISGRHFYNAKGWKWVPPTPPPSAAERQARLMKHRLLHGTNPSGTNARAV